MSTNDMNLNDISLDGETLSVNYDAPLVAIGAVAFDRTTGKLGAKFYREVDLQSAINSGRVHAPTLRWWINQSARAKDIFAIKADQSSLATALMDFSSWCRSVGKGVPRVWAKGPAEDITWVNHAMTVGGHGISVPWHHSNVRDVRTITELAEELADFNARSVPEVGEAHNALDDAIYQANVVCAAYKALRTVRGKPNPGFQVEDDGEL